MMAKLDPLIILFNANSCSALSNAVSYHSLVQ